MLCNVTGTLYLPNGDPATGIEFTLIPSVGGVVRGEYAQRHLSFRPRQGGAVDFIVESGEYVLRGQGLTDTVIFIPDQSSVALGAILPLPVPIRIGVPWVRKGATFELGCVWVDRYDVPESLDGVSVAADVSGGVPVAVTLDDDLNSGRFSLRIESSDTDSLRDGENRISVWFSRGAEVKSSMDIKFNVIGEV